VPLHIALVLSLALHLTAYMLADWAGLLAPPPPTARPLLAATLILPENAAVPPPELQLDEAQPVPTTEPALSVPPPPAESLPPPAAPAPSAAIQPSPPAETNPAAKPAPPEFYPHEAVRRGLEGEALVAVTLDGRGRVTGARLERGSGHAILDEAAIRAALSLRSMPGGTREATLPVSFRLR
jgi:protein TonB